jgi:DNA-binding NtrC family response regulator
MGTTKSSVIVYESDGTVGALLKELFFLHGYRAVVVEEPKNLIELLEENHASKERSAEMVIVAEPINGAPDGKTLHDLPQKYPELPFILLSSGLGTDGNRGDTRFSSVVKKPFRFKELSKILRETGDGFDNRAVDRNTTGYGE